MKWADLYRMAKQETTIAELDIFFSTAKLPSELQLYPGTKVVDLPTFVESHLAVLKHSGSHGIYEVFYTRLIRLREMMTAKS